MSAVLFIMIMVVFVIQEMTAQSDCIWTDLSSGQTLNLRPLSYELIYDIYTILSYQNFLIIIE